MSAFAKETFLVSLEDEMKRSYVDYAMSVIVGRALPDVRDGLKPVHRRILYAMHELNNDWNRAYKKSARIVGDVIGKYHPHGDASVYDSIVRMAQDFSLRYMLIDGQGNFGSVDGDGAAAMRYTEIRIAKIGHELLVDLDKETVDFRPNYDGSEHEPVLLPSRLPNLLVNGASGIAVGMATNIPPHNLGEVVSACQHLLRNPDASIDDLLEWIPAPDFPTAGIIYGLEEVRKGYRTGRGRVLMRAKTHFEPRQHTTDIVIDELPYQVNKGLLLERIANLVTEKRIEGISDIRDESNRNGMRVVIELKRGEYPEIVLNNLYKHTQLQESFGMNLVALIDGRPRLLNLKEILECFLAHRREIITRRTIFELKQARARKHILEGLAVALANIDEFIAIIRAAASPPQAKQELLARVWDAPLVRTLLARVENQMSVEPGVDDISGLNVNGLYRLSDIQAQEILQMRLQRLTGLEQEKILNEYSEIVNKIVELLAILHEPERVNQLIDDELVALKSEFSDPRRSQIENDLVTLNQEDLITPQQMMVTISHAGYIKSLPLDDYRAQKRGGRGKQAASMKQNDWIEALFTAHTHDYVLCFSNQGKVYWLKVYDMPQGTRYALGRPVSTLFALDAGEKITVVLPVKSFDEDQYVFMATAYGVVKKTPLSAFSRPMKRGIIAVNLDEGDYLVGAAITDGKHDVMLFSDSGKAVRFSEEEVRPVGRGARGVRGMQLGANQLVIAMLVAVDAVQSVLTATENGFGKRTAIAEYSRHARGSKGMIAIQTSKRNGKVVAATLANTDSEIMLITTAGVLIRTRANEVREMSRVTQGVTLLALDSGDKLSSVQLIVDADQDANEE